ncbi:hypothetical protein HDF12_000990 [Edaphobacter lichenicola]|uniref:Uncharacterized protein n=1 Tax=Tunturiibacter lichenicola TaxID=2051959 RepID=A0A7Y9T8L2_9BACT|nr:hypothetical protein [Edaphobacter lichenicola]
MLELKLREVTALRVGDPFGRTSAGQPNRNPSTLQLRLQLP